MGKRLRILPVLLGTSLALILGVAYSSGRGGNAAKGGGAEETPFDDARIFFEFNSTDDDLGVQVLLDGEAWNRLKILDPDGRQILTITARGTLGELGLTELFWESDEPSPDEVLALFQAGDYEFEGVTVEGDRLEGEASLSHDLAPSPIILEPSSPGEVMDRTNTVIMWQAIPGIAGFEIIVENEEVGAEMLVPLPASRTSLHVPVEFLDANTQYKVEVLAISENGNKTISEREFVTGP